MASVTMVTYETLFLEVNLISASSIDGRNGMVSWLLIYYELDAIGYAVLTGTGTHVGGYQVSTVWKQILLIYAQDGFRKFSMFMWTKELFKPVLYL